MVHMVSRLDVGIRSDTWNGGDSITAFNTGHTYQLPTPTNE